jgi:hypothetical protein
MPFDYTSRRRMFETRRDGSGTFPVWSEGLRLYPTYVLLGTALVAGLSSVLLVFASFFKNVRGECRDPG